MELTTVLGLSFFAVLPDIDVFFLPHRAVFHNVFILIIPMLLFILIRTKRDVFGIIGFYLLSHLVLDMFNGGISLLYPVYDDIFFAYAELGFNDGSLGHVLDYGTRGTIINVCKGEPVVSSENFAVSVLIMIIVIIIILQSFNKKK